MATESWIDTTSVYLKTPIKGYKSKALTFNSTDRSGPDSRNRLATLYNCEEVSKGVDTFSLTLSQNRLTLLKRPDRQIWSFTNYTRKKANN